MMLKLMVTRYFVNTIIYGNIIGNVLVIENIIILIYYVKFIYNYIERHSSSHVKAWMLSEYIL